MTTLTHPAEVRPTPIRRLCRGDAGTATDFVAALDDETRRTRFDRFMTPAMVRAHYDALDWDAAVLAAWVTDGALRGLAEALLYRTPAGLEAEIALCVAPGWTGHGISDALVAYAADEAARRGAWRSVTVLACGDHEHAGAARRLGARLDARHGLAVLLHASNRST